MKKQGSGWKMPVFAVFTMCVEDKRELTKEWMMFTFFSDRYKGVSLEKSERESGIR